MKSRTLRALAWIFLGSALIPMSCARSHMRVDPDVYDGVGGGGTESQDVRTMADTMSRDLLAEAPLDETQGRPTVHILGLANNASHPIDKSLVVEMIRTRLVRHGGRRVRILNRDAATHAEIRNERKAKRDGAVQGSEKKALLGSDYVLTGSVRTISKRGRDGMSSDYWVYSFFLVDLESSEQVWANEYDFKWAGNKPAIYR